MLNETRKVLHHCGKNTVAVGDEWHVSARSFPCCLTLTRHGTLSVNDTAEWPMMQVRSVY